MNYIVISYKKRTSNVPKPPTLQPWLLSPPHNNKMTTLTTPTTIKDVNLLATMTACSEVITTITIMVAIAAVVTAIVDFTHSIMLR